MKPEFLVYKTRGDEPLHAKFVLNKADSNCGIDIAAVLCMENKKSG